MAGRKRRKRRTARSSLPAHIREAERWLVRKFPLRRSHEIHVRPLRRNAAWHKTDGGLSVIVIEAGLPDWMQIHLLIHEWAHARERGKPRKGEREHSKRWGREYWPIYSAWYD